MFNLKKAIVLLLAATIILSTTGCEDRRGNTSSSVPPEPSAPSSDVDVEAKTPDEPVESEWPRVPSSGEPSPENDPRFTPQMQVDFSALQGLDTTAVQWGWGPHVDNDNRSVSCTALQEKYGKYNAFFIAPNDNSFYLTFDEGYENGYTAAILDVLKEKETPAVFFITGDYAKRNPELIRRMIEEGHMVGNHSVNHPNFTNISIEKAYEEIKGLHDYVLENYDYSMSVFRYPEGAFNEQTLALLDQLGYRTAFWSFAYADWDPNAQMENSVALEKAEKAVHPGSLYLLHAVSKTNAEILGQFIDDVRAQGYEFKSFYLYKEEAE